MSVKRERLRGDFSVLRFVVERRSWKRLAFSLVVGVVSCSGGVVDGELMEKGKVIWGCGAGYLCIWIMGMGL